MDKLTLIATAPMGIEALVNKEVKNLGFTDTIVENGKVIYTTDIAGMVRSNLHLRCADRVHIKIGEFTATSFEELFQGVLALPWVDYVSENGSYIVNAKSVKSALFSLSDIQSISKKAIIKKLQETYKKEWFSENGEKYGILISILKDKVTVMLDTSGTPLHKRGYRAHGTEAPIKETLAASLVMLSNWDADKVLIDPFCGSGTILIEAAMIALNIAPGINRHFEFEDFFFVDPAILKEEKKKAYSAIDYDKELKIFGSDIDKNAVDIAIENCELAGVDHVVSIKQMDFKKMFTTEKGGVIICNPPYGERLEDKSSVERIYMDMGSAFKSLDSFSYYVITSDEDFEKLFGRRSNKNRKLYNGRIKCHYYQYFK